MPLGVVSHQGLIAPLWRRWPRAFDIPAMAIGASLPDVVDAASFYSRGHFAQGIGHSFAGLAVFGIPAGLVLWVLLHAAARRLRPVSESRFFGRLWNRARRACAEGVQPNEFARRSPRVLASMALGALSHLLFDLISHGGFPWMMPWVPKIKIFPAWWYAVWVRIPVPGYRTYAIGPYYTIGLLLSILGIYLLCRPAFHPTENPATPRANPPQ